MSTLKCVIHVDRLTKVKGEVTRMKHSYLHLLNGVRDTEVFSNFSLALISVSLGWVVVGKYTPTEAHTWEAFWARPNNLSGNCSLSFVWKYMWAPISHIGRFVVLVFVRFLCVPGALPSSVSPCNIT